MVTRREEVKRTGMSRVPAYLVGGMGFLLGGLAIALDTFGPKTLILTPLALAAGFNIGYAINMYRLTVWTNDMTVLVDEMREAFDGLIERVAAHREDEPPATH